MSYPRARNAGARRLLAIAIVLAGAVGAAGAQETGELAFARQLLRDGMYDLASLQLQDYIENHPNSPQTKDAFLQLADAYRARESYARAADTYEGFMVKYPQDVRVRELWLKQAELRALAGQHEMAARAYQELSEAYSESDFADDALLGMATSLLKIGAAPRAERTLVNMIDRYPSANSVSRGRVLLGQVRLERGAAALAEQALSPLLREPTFSNDIADALLLGTNANLALGRIPDAIRLSTRLIDQARGDDRAWRARMAVAQYLLGTGERTGEREYYDRSADYYKECARRATPSSLREEALFDLARVRELQNTPALALSNWRDFMSSFPHSPRRPRAMLGLGRSNIANGDDRDGIFALEELLSAYPDSSESVTALGDLAGYYLGRGDATTALAYYERQHTRTPAGFERRRLALTVAEIRETRLQEPDQARLLYAALAEGDDDVAARALFGVARCRRTIGDVDAAEEAYQQVTRRFPAHELAPAASDSLTFIRLFLRPDLAGGLSAAISLEARELIHEGDPNVIRRRRMLDLARIRVRYFKNYEEAIALLQAYLAQSDAEYPDRGEHLLATCYLRLAMKAGLTHDDSSEAMHRRNALEALARLATRYPESDLADDAFIETTEARLAEADSAHAANMTLDAYADFFTRYPGSDRRAFVLVRLAENTVAQVRTGSGSPDEALRQFDEALTIAPNGVELDRSLFGSALILAQQGRQDEARERLERLIAERPLSGLVPEARYQLALILLDRGRPRDAARELAKLLRSRDMSRDANEIRTKLITAHLKSDSFEEIVPVARRMATSGGDDAAAWGARQLASALIELRRRDEAEQVIASELSARPNSDDADSLTILRARILVDRRQLERAAQVLIGFEQRHPRSKSVPVAWGMLARVQFDVDSFEEALANFRRVLQANADDRDARMGEVLCLYRLGRADEAQGRERAVRDLAPLTEDEEIRLAIERGHALKRGRDWVGAVEAFASVVERNPNSQWAPHALLAQGRVAAASGRIEPAVQAFEKLMRQYPDSPLRQDAAFELGNAYFNTKLYEQAADAYERALDIDTTSRHAPDALWRLILSYERIQRIDTAIRTMRLFKLEYPDHEKVSRIWVKIASDLSDLGEFEEAVEAFLEALEHVSGQDATEARFWLADTYFKLGQNRQAAVEWLKLAYHGQSQGQFPVTARFRAAIAFERMGRADDAATLYRQIMAMEGQNSNFGSNAALRLMALDEARASDDPTTRHETTGR